MSLDLDEIERECRDWMSARPTGQNLNFMVTRLARAVLAMLPVVRMAVQAADARCQCSMFERHSDACEVSQVEDALFLAVDTMRRETGKP